MKKLLTIILFLPCYLFAQQNVNTDNTLILDTAPEPDVLGVNPAVVAMKSDIKTISDTTKALRAGITTAQSTASDAIALAGAGLSAANSAAQVNSNQSVTLTTHTNQINNQAAQISDLQTKVSALQSATNTGIIPTVSVTLPSGLTTAVNGMTLKITNAGTLTIPQLPDGFKCTLVNASPGTVSIVFASGVTKLNTGVVTSLSKGSQPRELTVFSNNVVNIR